MVVTEAPIYRALWELTAVLPTAVLDALYAILTQFSHRLRDFHVITRNYTVSHRIYAMFFTATPLRCV